MRTIFGLLLFALVVCGCSKSPRCAGDDENTGIIFSTIQIGCEPTTLLENYVIASDSAYHQTFTDVFCTLPPIDFNSYTLLGARASGQCEIKMLREVTRVEAESKYLYKITVKSCGLCKKLAYTDNWVLVPKLPSGWAVAFEVVED
jgi:hypothetical protein